MAIDVILVGLRQQTIDISKLIELMKLTELQQVRFRLGEERRVFLCLLVYKYLYI